MYILIDNYDSFTYNLYHSLAEQGAEVQVIRNDACSVKEIMDLNPQGIILSPGPCTPDKAGICLDLIAYAAQHKIPLLGVCLGHQAIGQAFGAKIITLKTVSHGKTVTITHNGTAFFKEIPTTTTVTLYHSLAIDPATLPDEFIVNAQSSEQVIMSISHKTLPLWGVQFHPESIRTEYGGQMIKNFLSLAENFKK